MDFLFVVNNIIIMSVSYFRVGVLNVAGRGFTVNPRAMIDNIVISLFLFFLTIYKWENPGGVLFSTSLKTVVVVDFFFFKFENKK